MARSLLQVFGLLVVVHLLCISLCSCVQSQSQLICRSGARQLHFDFLRSPKEILTGADGRAQVW